MDSFTHSTGTTRSLSQTMQWQPSNIPATSFEITSQASKIVKKLMNKLSLAILCTQGEKDDKSKVVSSVSLTPVVGMILLSMDDKARKALILGIPEESLTDELETEIHKKLGEFSKDHSYGNHGDEDQAVFCANFIATRDATRNEQFEQNLSECYQTKKLECHDSCIGKVTEDFINEKTNGRIKKLFEGYSKTQLDKISAVIGNVMEFLCSWEHTFPLKNTCARSFLCADGTRIDNVKMMRMTEVCHYSFNNIFGAIAKNFRSANGEELKLVAITPQKESATAINRLDSGTIDYLIDGLNRNKAKFHITLPKIKIENSCDSQLLEKICKEFGTDVIRAEDLSRLGNFWNHDFKVFQKITTTIDEEGARGKVATKAEITERGLSKIPSFGFVCPGYMAIVDKKGNRLLELIVKDGDFFEFYPGEENSAKTLKSNDMKADKSLKPNDLIADSKRTSMENSTDHTKRFASKIDVKTTEKTIQSIKDKLNDDKYFLSLDVSALIHHSFDPNGEFNIKSADATKSELSIKTDSKENAIKIKEKIIEWLNYKNQCFIEIWEDSNRFKVDISFSAWDTIREKLTSKQS